MAARHFIQFKVVDPLYISYANLFKASYSLCHATVQYTTRKLKNKTCDKHVYGVPPMRLAAEAAMLTEMSMVIPAEWRGQELTLEQIKTCSPTLATYVVKRQ